MVEEMLAARGIEVAYETVRRWALQFAQKAARRIRAYWLWVSKTKRNCLFSSESNEIQPNVWS